jgi:tetratricopeptide (TPR) repeat protein
MAGIAFKWIYYRKMRWDKLKKISIVLILFMAVVSCSILTSRRNSVWKDGESLWLDVLKKYPEVPQAHNNLGVFYDKKKGMRDKAISEFKKALKINPNYSNCYYNLGSSYEKKGMTDEAIAEYKKAIEINPNFPKAHGNLGFIYIDNKMSSLGADHLYKAGLLFLKQGDKKNALKAYKGLKLTKSEELQKALFKKLYPDVK